MNELSEKIFKDVGETIGSLLIDDADNINKVYKKEGEIPISVSIKIIQIGDEHKFDMSLSFVTGKIKRNLKFTVDPNQMILPGMEGK